MAAFGVAFLTISSLLVSNVTGFSNYVSNVPNGSVNSCNTCHQGAGTPFKTAFANTSHTWTVGLATSDSDGDGFTNGEELQEPTGTWTTGAVGNTAKVSIPNDPTSYPPAPVITDITGVTASSNVSGTLNLALTFETTIGMKSVTYDVLDGSNNVVKTVSSTSATTYAANLDTRTVTNGTYTIRATASDKRKVSGSDNPQTGTRSEASVTFSNVPLITSQPSSQTAATGGSATFSVSGTNVVSYQWRKAGTAINDGGNISGATTSQLTISNASSNDEGSYDVVLTNATGSTTSATVSLSVGAQSQTATIRLISAKTSDGNPGSGSSTFGTDYSRASGAPTRRAVSADGRYVVFSSNAAGNDLVTPDSNNRQDVFVRDLKAGTTRMVSVNTAGTDSGNGDSETPLISANGRYVVFKSKASDISNPAGPGGFNGHIFRRDLETNTTIPVSIKNDNLTFETSPCDLLSVSADGRYVTFVTYGAIVSQDQNSAQDIYRRDCQTGVTELVSINQAGTLAGNSDSIDGDLTPDGRYVIFVSTASDLAPGYNGTNKQVFRRDMQTGTTILVSVINGTTGSPAGECAYPSISADGRYVAFQSFATDLLPGVTDTSPQSDIFRRDCNSQTVILCSAKHGESSYATTGFPAWSFPAISADGRYVFFYGYNSDLVPNDAGNLDIFRRDCETNDTILVSAVNGTSNFGSGGSSGVGGGMLRISDDGRFCAFLSDYSNLTSGDSNGKSDIFRRDCLTNATSLVSGGTGSGSNWRLDSISASGLTIVFETDSSELVSNDSNGATDIFAGTYTSAPAVNAGPDATVAFNAAFNQNGSFSDLNGTDTHTATVDYGDQSGVQSLTLNGTSFALSKTYAASGTYTITVTVTDSSNLSSTDTVKVTVNPPPPTITSDLLTSGIVNQPFSYKITATGAGTISYNAAAPLPDGLSFATDTISGTPTTSGSTDVTISATSEFGTTTKTLKITINPEGAPLITSATTANTAVGLTFSYKITASGTGPITFNATPMPPGLSFSGDSISGTPTTQGSYDVTLEATNAIAKDTRILKINVGAQGAGVAPQITSALSISVTAGAQLSYTITANGSGTITFDAANLPTRLTLSGATITGAVASVGTFSVTLTATNDVGSDTRTLTITSGAPAIAGSDQSTADSDGDGFPDELEDAFDDSPNKTDKYDPGSTPVGDLPADQKALGPVKLSLKLNFLKKDQDADQVALSGLLPAAGVTYSGLKVIVNVGGVIDDYTLNEKGQSADKAFRISKPNKKTGMAKFALKLKGNYQSKLADEGLVGTSDITVPLDVPIGLIFNGKLYTADPVLTYKAKAGKTGSAK